LIITLLGLYQILYPRTESKYNLIEYKLPIYLNSLPGSSSIKHPPTSFKDSELPLSNTTHIQVIHKYRSAGLPIHYVPTIEDLNALTCSSNPWDLFTNATELGFSEIMTIHEANQGLIDLLKDDSGLQLSIKQSLKSTYILKQKIDKM
jgi:hypothetical protein